MNKHVLYLLLFGFCFISCSRTTLSHQRTDELKQEDSVSTNSTERTEQYITNEGSSEQNSRDSEENRIIIKFDTEKPVLPGTGLPPVKEISFTGKTVNEKTELNKTISKTGDIKEVKKDSTSVQTQSKTKVDNKTEKEVNPYLATFWRDISFIFLIVFLFWLIDLIIKNWPKIKELWKRIRGQ